MKDTTEFHYSNTAVTLGKFDGFHIGHRVLFDYLKTLKKKGYKTVVFTFSLHPSTLFSDSEIQLIYTEEEKKRQIESLGIDVQVAYPFTRETVKFSPKDFIKEILVKKLDAKVIVIGSDFCFGYQRRGNAALLKELSKQYDYQVVVFEKRKIENTIVSSSAIRDCIKQGKIEAANQMLGRPYHIFGEVVHGKQLGRTLGMPTANLVLDREKLLPPNGVYVSRTLLDGKWYKGITNIGCKPTVGGQEKGVETYLFDFSGDFYGKWIEVELYAFVREEQRFSSLEDLKKQMHQDMAYGKTYPFSLSI